jgi:hypothetical protein
VLGKEGARKEEAIIGDKYWTGAETLGDPTPLIKIRPANASVCMCVLSISMLV